MDATAFRRQKPPICLAAAVALAAVACGSGGSNALPGSPASSFVSTPSPLPPSPTPSVSDAVQAAPAFHGTVSAIDPGTSARMTSSWHPGCPVPIADLRYLRLSHWGFDGVAHSGEMVVHKHVAGAVVKVFGKLFAARFPIRRMRLVDAYGGDDDRSMAANNTSAFNCRMVTGGSGWSQHAYGWAIDINPIQNPYVTRSGTVLPPEGAKYANRSLSAKGMIHAGDVVVRAFASVGWGWGGTWSGTRDYQHFSATGR
jgi:hypothetical protein